MANALEIAESILAATQELVVLAEQGELEAFRTAQTERDALIARLDNEPLDVSDPEAMRALLVEAQQLNNQLSEALTAQEQVLLDEKAQLKLGKKMQKAYGSGM